PSWWASVADAVRPGGLGHGFCAVGHAWSQHSPGPVRRCTDVRSGRSGCHRLIHPSVLVLLDSLSLAQMEPEVGFEPTTFRLRVEEPSSSVCRPDPFWLLTSAGSSVECVPDLPSHGRGGAQRKTPPP